ncbi:protein disulfide-isomerase TMX3 [Planococcus citri]|uniref:protein disulfide-isomerase TMX3 n=1 Tax=Planococcus citri TaxID=170843 RepID=UPI0031F8D73E
MYIQSGIILFLGFIVSLVSSVNPRVLELNERFLDVKKDGNWLVMFYAPWCAHCKRLDPIWSQVQQTLHTTNIRVSKMDCVSNKNACHLLKIQTYPTIMFLKGDQDQFIYNGDRSTEEIVHFTLRVANPPVRKFNNGELIDRLKREKIIFFSYLGEPKGDLWDLYREVAVRFQPYSYFYHAPPSIAKKHFKSHGMPAIVVHKENNVYVFDESEWSLSLNHSLHRWVNEERFPTFMKITRLNINSLMETNKFLVLAIVEENKVQEIPDHMKEFKNMVESVIKNYRDRFHRTFQFGWVGTPDLANSIAMMKVPLPYLLVLNSTTNHHHIPEDEPTQLTPEAITIFLDSIQNQSAKTYGGNHFFISLYRMYFEVLSNLSEMWKGNPVLTAVVFGLPLGFLSLICYSICCADILDADDEECDDGHEKKE